MMWPWARSASRESAEERRGWEETQVEAWGLGRGSRMQVRDSEAGVGAGAQSSVPLGGGEGS